jgi:hypothetical protein
MTAAVASVRWTEFGLVRTGVVFTILAGTVAVVLPFLNALVVALAAITLAGAVRPGPSRPAAKVQHVRLLQWFAGVSVVVGAALFVTLPAPWFAGRGIVLGVSLIPLLAAIGPGARSDAVGGVL